jgi:hypothetical protein
VQVIETRKEPDAAPSLAFVTGNFHRAPNRQARAATFQKGKTVTKDGLFRVCVHIVPK